jgi:pyruvate,water dikinase
MDVPNYVRDIAGQYGIASSLCWQASSTDPAFASHPMRMGITSISVDPDAVLSARREGRHHDP